MQPPLIAKGSRHVGQHLDIEVIEGRIALLTLRRPEARNAINAVLAAELAAAVKAVEQDPAIWVAILTGSGEKAFCAGADLKEVAEGGLHRQFTDDGGFAGLTRAARAKPWIAAVNGVALAGGFELVLACDLVVAVEHAEFGLPEVTRGLIPSGGGAYRLPRVIPRALALEMIATGRAITAREAWPLGLLNRIVDPSHLLEESLSMARAIVANAPLAVRESLVIARQALDADDATLFRLGDQAQERVHLTADFSEGTRAFVEKRPPKWAGK